MKKLAVFLLAAVLIQSTTISCQFLEPSLTFQGFPDAPPPLSFVDLTADFQNLFDFIFAYLGLPNSYGSTLDNLYSSSELELCAIHNFVLHLTGCDLFTESCDFKAKNAGLTQQRNMPRVYVDQGLEGIHIFLKDDVGNGLEIEQNAYFDLALIHSSWGNFLILNETETDSVVEAHSHMGDVVTVWEDERTRKVSIRNMLFESQNFEVELGKTNFSCFLCDCA